MAGNNALSTMSATPWAPGSTAAGVQTTTPAVNRGGTQAGPIASGVTGVLGGISNLVGNIGQSFNNALAYNKSTPDANGNNLYGGMLNPISKISTTDTAGNNVTTTHAPPATQTKSATASTPAATPTSTATAAPIPTQASQQQAGQTITDTQGRQGTALYNPMTGQPYSQPTSQADQNAIASQATPGTFPGYVSNIGTATNQGVNNINAAATGNQAAPEIGALNQNAYGNYGLGQNAENIANNAGQQINSLGQQGAGMAGGYAATPLGGLGAGQIINQGLAARQNAITQGANMQLQGNSQALTGQSQAANAFNSAAGNALTNQSQQIQGATSAGQLGQTGATSQATLAQPQQYGLTNQPYNPLSDTYGGGASGGAINRAVNASNIGSAQDFQSKINTIQATAPAADAAFQVLNSYAQAIGDGNIPIVQGLQKLYGSTAQGNAAVAGFQSQLQSVRAAWTAIEGGDPTSAIPDNVTATQLSQIQQQLQTDSKNKVTGYQNQLSQLGASGGTSGSTGGSFGGSAWQ